MSLLRKYRKNATKTVLRFAPEMYNNVLGSLVITHYILDVIDENNTYNIEDIKKTWKSLTKKKDLDFWLDDKDFIPKALALFNMEPEYGRFAMCQSDFNILFLPYINEQPMPVREDGIFPMSARNGKIYPINNPEEVQNVSK